MKICFILGKQVDVSKETGGNMALALPITRTEEGDTSMLRRVKKYKTLIIAGSLLLLLCLVLYLVLLVWTIRAGSCWDQLIKQ